MNTQSLLLIQQYFYIILPFIIIDMILKGFAMWRTAQNKSSYWFIALFIFNTVGILPLLYLVYFSKKNNI